ncbi:MAG: hypothetical protein FI725_02220 [SAR202 cluster bacterium]|nr:hypothetical protein [SAR202 cluster bacterium]|tara:strand:+ start:408 stop:632 length:225 start_codon:yes stop_codon:yes gene_type:complete
MPTKVVGEVTWAVFSLPWLVARDEGLFAEQDLDVEIVEAGKAIKPDAPIISPTDVKSILGHHPYENNVVNTYCG